MAGCDTAGRLRGIKMPAFVPTGVSGLQPSLGITLTSAINARLGASVSAAGDVNGDGFADVIVANAPLTGGPSSAYVVFGAASGASVNLASAGTGVWRINGVPSDINLGLTVCAAGDVNGDGFGDLILGTPMGGIGNRGATYVLLGRPGGFSDIDVTAGALGLTRVTGAAAGDFTGQSVAAAGDFNGDGYADIVLGGQNYGSFGFGGYGGRAYVVFGSASGIGNLDLADAGNVFRIDGNAGDDVGRVVAGVGDINGDGLADIATAGYNADPLGRADAGMVTVIFGNTVGYATVNANSIGSGGFHITGASANNQAGGSVSSAGDVNGDGWGDLIVGAQYAQNNGRTNSGSAYVIFGHSGNFADVDLANLGSAGFRIDGAVDWGFAGSSVASAGDVNGDGFSDLLIGEPGFQIPSPSGVTPRYASAFLLLGHAGGFGNLDLASAGSSAAAFGDATPFIDVGYHVAGAGDVDGDGFGDILFGAPGFTDGAAYLLYSQSIGGALYRGTTLADTLRGTPDNDSVYGYGGNDRLFGNAGDDTMIGGAGNDLIDGGAGTDLAVFNGTRSQYVIGVLGDQALIAGPDGIDRLSGIENVQFSGAAPVGLGTLGSAGLFTIAGGLGAGFRVPDLYSGPVNRLQTQLLGSAGGDLAIGTSLNDFFNLLGGDDAVQAGAGDDVIDGGTGSNFLTGGAGRDDFFLDGRGLGTTWSTITDWQAGETLSVFGWTPGVSRMLWRDNDGTAGYQGVTLHADLDGNGLIETSVTWTGLTQAALPTPQSLSGLLWFI